MSTVLKGFKIRAYPNATQRALVARTLGTKRWLWNTALDLRSAAYKELGLRLTSTDISRMLTLRESYNQARAYQRITARHCQ